MALASISDVTTTLGRPLTSTLEGDQIQQWLNNAEMQIRLRLGDVSLLDPEAVIYVETEAVALKVKNPDGKKSEGIDDYNYGRYEDAAKGQIVILDEWWSLLSSSPARAAGAFTIDPSGAADTGWTDNARAANCYRDPTWWRTYQ